MRFLTFLFHSKGISHLLYSKALFTFQVLKGSTQFTATLSDNAAAETERDMGSEVGAGSDFHILENLKFILSFIHSTSPCGY